MAILTCNFLSPSLMRTVPLTVILPTDTFSPFEPTNQEAGNFKTLYLLHGFLGNHTDWVNHTRLLDYASQKKLCVVMPSGENHFYINHPTSGEKYSSYLVDDLIDFVQKSFPVSNKREDTFIGGLSMGGYGAIVNGLKHSDKFSHICALSSALVFDAILQATDETQGPFSRTYYQTTFGDLDMLAGSENDYDFLVENYPTEKEKPRVYLACGEEDDLLQANEVFRNKLSQFDFDVTWSKTAGGHDWQFWDQQIEAVLRWLPLEGTEASISSRNVSL